MQPLSLPSSPRVLSLPQGLCAYCPSFWTLTLPLSAGFPPFILPGLGHMSPAQRGSLVPLSEMELPAFFFSLGRVINTLASLQTYLYGVSLQLEYELHEGVGGVYFYQVISHTPKTKPDTKHSISHCFLTPLCGFFLWDRAQGI